jgi:hypothetical protein
MREFPNMLKRTKPYVDDGRLQVITVSADSAETLPDLRRTIHKYRLAYPVIYDGGIYDEEGGSPIPAVEWNIRGWPSSFLVNPQGVIVANDLRGDKLAPMLDRYLNGSLPIIGLRGYAVANDDRSVSVYAEVLSADHQPVEVTGDYYHADWIWDKDFVVIDEISGHDDFPEPAVLTFGDFGDAVYEFRLPPSEDIDYYAIWLLATVPGTEGIGKGDDAVITFEIRTNDVMLVEDFYYDEEIDDYRVMP